MFYGHFWSISFRRCEKDCLGFHQSETIALILCSSMNLLLEESGVFCPQLDKIDFSQEIRTNIEQR